MKTSALETDSLIELCCLDHENEERRYRIVLETDISSVSIEGLNQFRVTVSSQHKKSEKKEALWAALELNLRQEMNSVSIADGTPYYFTITEKSLDLNQLEIDSSIHEVVDLGLMDHKILSGIKPSHQERNESILFDSFTCNLIKASISVILAQTTNSHRQVIKNAGRLFASRQDYIRDMCNSLLSHTETLSVCIKSKALHCDQRIF